MLFIFRTTLFTLLLTLIFPLSAAVKTPVTYLTAEELNISTLLPPPPAADSPQDRADMQAVLAIQAERTPQQIARAKQDDLLEDAVFYFAKDILGPEFTLEKHPLTAEFFRRIDNDFVQSLMPAKAFYGRARPYEINSSIQPVLPPPEGQSYPSGHSMDGYLMAILLAQVVPEKRLALFERADEGAQSRVIAGVHYPSDLEGGKIAAFVLASRLLNDPRAQADLQKVKAEVRSHLKR